MNKRIALISAVAAAIAPATHELRAQLPTADLWNILDDRLLEDAAEVGGISDALAARMRRLIDHAVTEGADAVLLTCSMYAPIAGDGWSVPVLAPDGAAFDQIEAGGFGRVLVIAAQRQPMEDSVERLHRHLRAKGRQVSVVGSAIESAGATARSAHIDDVANAVLEAMDGRAVDAVFLAQYSLAPAAPILATKTSVRVITGPSSAAQQLHELLTD